jgi:arabinofuranan 3-O-arabinosyltransferase
VLVLPRSDFYQVPTTWGYYGVSFTRSMVRRPVFEVAPGGYFQQPAAVASFEEAIETDLVTGRPTAVAKKLEALGVRYVLLRRDVNVEFPNRRIARPNLLARNLMRVPGVKAFRSLGAIDIYRVDGAAGDEVFATPPILYADSSNALAPAVGVLGQRPGFITGTDGQGAVAQVAMHPVRVVRFEEEMVRRLAVKAQGGSVQIRLADPVRLSVEGRKLPSASPETIAAPLAGDAPVVITAGNAVHSLLRRLPHAWRELGPARLRHGQSLDVWRFVGMEFARPEAAGRVGDCHAVDARGADEVGIRAAVVESASRPALRLSARAHAACVTFALVRRRTPDLFTVRFRYRQLHGARARACLWQSGLNRCARVPDLRASRDWRTFEGVIKPDRRMTSLTLFLYADGRGRAPATVTEYQSIRLERYKRAASVPYAPARIQMRPEGRFPQGTVAVTRDQLPRPVDLTKPSSVEDCHRYDERTPAQLGLAARVIDRLGLPVLQLAARDHSACVIFPITPFEAGARDYRVRFDFRGVSGSAPRACLWQVGPDRCIAISDLRSDGEWRVLDRTLRLDPNVRGLQLFLYADGDGNGLTITEYRDAHVEPVRNFALLGHPEERPLPRIVPQREAPWRFRVRVEGAQAPFLLATSEAYAPGWKANAEGRDASELRHIEVNGYANGWLVPWTGSYELTLEYGPERYALAARRLSLVVLILLLLWVAGRGLNRLFVRRAERVRGQPGIGFRLPHLREHEPGRAIQRGTGASGSG